jgi:predicted  nucleic acid-binding Zn-ribbon protein
MHLVSSSASDRPPTLAELNEEERSISARRRRLHDRIDFLRAGGGGPLENVAQLLADLEQEEREVSAYRRDLHERIELMRAEMQSARGSTRG